LALRSNKNFNFFKYTSTGNDFILIEGEPFVPNESWAQLCHRRFGIGADGVLFYSPSSVADFKMTYFNADGAKVEMCGNGARALSAHFFSKNPKRDEVSFEVGEVIYRSKKVQDLFSVEMNEYRDHGSIKLDDLILPATTLQRDYLNTGVPHVVIELGQDIEQIDLEKLASPIRHDKRFVEGVNVNIFNILAKNEVKMRTWERGVEGETLSCGTGAMAVARSLWKNNPDVSDELEISVSGGKLRALLRENSAELLGPSLCVYRGEVNR
jgi:diaminopimelate epimerase